MVRLRSHGRGKQYTLVRGLLESSLRMLYRGGWPAKVWGAVPGACEVDRVQHELPLLGEGQPSLRVGFVSDIHLGPTTPARLVEAAFSHLRRANLDVLLLGGDYVFLDADARTASALEALVAEVPARRKLAVLGNHDLWTRHDLLETALLRAGVELLVNRNTTLFTAHPGVWVVGLDEPWTGHLDVASAFHGVRDAQTVVVLCHSPDGLPDAQRAVSRLVPRPRVLYVCGHTHGGHVASPWGPLVVPGDLGKRYPAGLYEVEGLSFYVSRGVGGVEVPVRAFARPEVAVFELASKSSSKS